MVNEKFLVLLLNFSQGCSFLMFEKNMTENTYDSISNMIGPISGKLQIELFCLLLSYMTNNKEIKRCSTNLGIPEKVDQQMKVF